MFYSFVKVRSKIKKHYRESTPFFNTLMSNSLAIINETTNL